jgi:hypothetical protein
MIEAPVAAREAPAERNVLRFIVWMADITPPSWLIVRTMEQPVSSDCSSNTASQKEVSNPQHCGWDREMNRCLGTAWRLLRSVDTEYRSRQLKGHVEVHVESGRFLRKGRMGLWSQLQERITGLPHRLFGGR